MPTRLLLLTALLLLAPGGTPTRGGEAEDLEKVCDRLEAQAKEAAALAERLSASGLEEEAAEVREERERLLLVLRSVERKLDKVRSDFEPPTPPGPGLPPAADSKPIDRPSSLSRRGDVKVLAMNGGDENTERAVDLGLEWLAHHQDPLGHWDCNGFSARCKLNLCDGAGGALYDPGVTGLAVLAFLGAGETHRHGEHHVAVKRALRRLKGLQDPEGCVGPRTDPRYMYNHAIGALALVEAYGATGSPLFRTSAQSAVDFVHRAQNPYLAWRYGVRAGDNDTSVTIWMVSVLFHAKRAGLRVDPAGIEGTRAWIDKVTEPEFGRVGYTARSTLPERPEGLRERYPPDRTESLTAMGVLVRVLAGEVPQRSEMIAKGADIVARRPPRWDEALGTVDMCYWLWGTQAMFQVGGKPWKSWNAALKSALLDHQRKDGDAKGSWDPAGPWGGEGGRVYATAACVLALETYYRHPRLSGDR